MGSIRTAEFWRRLGESAMAFWPVSLLVFALSALVLFLTAWGLFGDLPTGFSGKTLWDWIDVLGVLLVVVVAGGLFGFATQRASQRAELERELATDQARQDTLRAYLDRMAALVLQEKGLLNSEPGSAIRAVAQAQTFAALRVLDGTRKAILIRFLHDSQLISKERPIISLSLAARWTRPVSRCPLRLHSST
jgi:hypothetical protein